MKSVKVAIVGFAVGLALSGPALAAKTGNKGVSNIENQTKIYVNTSAGKARSEWSAGRVIGKGESVQCSDPAFRRFGVERNC